MRVLSIQVTVTRIPLDPPAAHALSRFEYRDYALIQITSDEGLEGFSYCIGDRYVALSVRELARVVLGRDPIEIAAIWDDLYHAVRPLGRRGAAMVALSALDNALWDLRAKAVGLPLYRLLGARTDIVPAYASSGVYADGATLGDLREEYAGLAAAGFSSFKMRIGRLSLQDDVARVHAVRETIGSNAQLAIDANTSWRSVGEAMRFVDAVKEYNIDWIEEPFHPEALGNYQALAARTTIPISLGEQESGRWQFATMIQSGAISILQPDVTVIGGVSEWLRVASTGATFSLAVMPHYFPPLHVHLACACPGVERVEYVPMHKLVNADLLFIDPPMPHEGFIRPPDAPGFGLTLNPEAVERYRLDSVRID
jgi:L-alanine-DL-glutamate epimerase-like enolase superfamily enzyme